MNGKRAKVLRKTVEILQAVGDVSSNVMDCKTILVWERRPDGYTVQVPQTTYFYKKGCARRVYQQLKAEYRSNKC